MVGIINYLVRACVYILSFVVVFQAMKCINYEKLLKQGHVAQAQILYFLIVAGLAYLVGSFVMVFIN
jgi:uncharacterized membrane protein YwzB